jgi:hypothetical protein
MRADRKNERAVSSKQHKYVVRKLKDAPVRDTEFDSITSDVAKEAKNIERHEGKRKEISRNVKNKISTKTKEKVSGSKNKDRQNERFAALEGQKTGQTSKSYVRPKRQKVLVGAEGMDYRKWKEVTLDAKGQLDPKLTKKGYEILDTNPESYKHILRTAKVINARERKARLARTADRQFPKREQKGSVVVTPSLNAKLHSRNARVRRRGEATLAMLKKKEEIRRVDQRNSERFRTLRPKSERLRMNLTPIQEETTAVANSGKSKCFNFIRQNRDIVDQYPVAYRKVTIDFTGYTDFHTWLIDHAKERFSLAMYPMSHIDISFDGKKFFPIQDAEFSEDWTWEERHMLGQLGIFKLYHIHRVYELDCCPDGEGNIYSVIYSWMYQMDKTKANGPFDTLVAIVMSKVKAQLIESLPFTIAHYAYFVEAIFASVTFIVAAYQYQQGQVSGILFGMMAATMGVSLVGRGASLVAAHSTQPVAQGGNQIEHESIISSVWNFFANVFKNNNSEASKDTERQKRIFSITLMFKSVEKILINVGEFFLVIFKQVYSWIRGEPYISPEDAKRFVTMLDLVAIFQNELTNRDAILKSKMLNTMNVTRRNNIEKYVAERDRLMRDVPGEVGINVVFQRCEKIFDEWKKEVFERAIAQTRQTVRQPASLVIVASLPGAGKSSIQSLLTAPFGASDLFTVAKDSDYWEGYHGQRGVIIDDLFQSLDKESRNHWANELIELGSDNPKNLNMAFGGKGSTFFESEFIVATTNVMKWDNLGIENIGALIRRVSKFVWVEPREGVATLVGESGKSQHWVWHKSINENRRYHPADLWRMRVCEWADDNSNKWTITDKKITFEELREIIHSPVRVPVQPQEYLDWLAKPTATANGGGKREIGDVLADMSKFVSNGVDDLKKFFSGATTEEYSDTDENSTEQYEYNPMTDAAFLEEGKVDIPFFKKILAEMKIKHAMLRKETAAALDAISEDLKATKIYLDAYKALFVDFAAKKPWLIGVLVTGLAGVFTIIGKIVYNKITEKPVVAEGTGHGYSDQPPPANDKARVMVSMRDTLPARAEANRQLQDAYSDVLRRTFLIEIYDNARELGFVYGYAIAQGQILTVCHILHEVEFTAIRFTSGDKSVLIPRDDMEYKYNKHADVLIMKLANPKYSLPGVREGRVNFSSAPARGVLHTLRFTDGMPSWYTITPGTYEYRAQLSYAVDDHVQANNAFCLQYNHIPSECGDCGLPVFSVGTDGITLVGIHVASDITACYAVHAKGWEPVAQGRNKVPHLKNPEAYNIDIVRTVTRPEATTLPTESRLKRSKISYLLPWSTELFPARLSPFMSHGSLISPLHNSMKLHFHPKPCPYTVEDVKAFNSTFCEPLPEKIPTVSPYDIHSSPYVQKNTWNLNASPGLPWTKMGYTKVADLFDGDKLKDQVRVAVDVVMTSKDFSSCVFTASLKDEKLKAAKVANGSTRMFYGAPFVFTYIGKYLLGPYADYMHGQACKLKSFSAVGINPHGPQWTMLGEKHIRFTRHFDGDSSKHDRRCQKWWAYLFAAHVLSIYGMICDPVFVGQIHLLVNNFCAHIFGTSIQLGTLIYMMLCGLVSGHPITSLLNTFIIAFAYFMALKRTMGGIPHDFFEHIAFTAYGDDHVLSTDLDLDLIKIIREVETSGLVISDARKTETLKWTSTAAVNQSLNGIVFLKRQFIKRGGSPFFSAPLETATLEAMPHWIMTNKNIDDYTMTQNVVDSFVRELVHLSRDTAEYYYSEIKRACATIGLPLAPYDFRTMYNSLYGATVVLDGSW